MIRLKWTGPEHVREVRRADLGVHPDSEETLVWDASNNWTVEVEEAEAEFLHRGSGGTWARVLEEETSDDPNTEDEPLPVIPMTRPVDSPEEVEERYDADNS